MTNENKNLQEPESTAAPSPEAEDKPSEERDLRKELEEQVTALKGQVLRALADAENTRKRAQKEREEIARFGINTFARELLHISDNLKRAITSIEAKEKETSDKEIISFIEGVKMTERELLRTFERHGISKICPKIGDPFDHNKHEAMFEIETDEKPAGTIMEVMQEGYMLHDRLLRPSLVGIAKTKSSTNPQEEKSS